MKLPSKLDPKNVVAIVDTREQTPLDLSPLAVERSALCTGDYSLVSCPDACRIERKSLPDLIQCISSDRDRFEREVARLLAYPVRVFVIEATWQQIESHEPAMPQWRGKVSREAVIGSLLGWQALGLSVHMAGDHTRAGKHVARLLFTVARRRYAELRSMIAGPAESIEVAQNSQINPNRLKPKEQTQSSLPQKERAK